MSIKFLVRHADGTSSKQRHEDMKPGDRLILCASESTSVLEAADKALQAEIAEAGGLESWRAQAAMDPGAEE